MNFFVKYFRNKFDITMKHWNTFGVNCKWCCTTFVSDGTDIQYYCHCKVVQVGKLDCSFRRKIFTRIPVQLCTIKTDLSSNSLFWLVKLGGQVVEVVDLMYASYGGGGS